MELFRRVYVRARGVGPDDLVVDFQALLADERAELALLEDCRTLPDCIIRQLGDGRALSGHSVRQMGDCLAFLECIIRQVADGLGVDFPTGWVHQMSETVNIWPTGARHVASRTRV